MLLHPAPAHNCRFVKDEIQTQIENIEALAAVVEPLLTAAELSVLTIQSVNDKLQARTKALRTQVAQSFERIREAVNQRERALLAEVDDICRRKGVALQAQSTQITVMSRDVQHGVAFSKQLLQFGTPVEVIMTKPFLVERLAQLSGLECEQSPCADPNMYLIANESQVFQKLADFGAIVPSLASLCRVTGSGIATAEVNVPAEFAVECDYAAEILDQDSCRLVVRAEQTQVNPNTDTTSSNRECVVTVRRAQGNSFVCEYTPLVAGVLKFEIFFNGELIGSGPISVEVKSKTFSGILVAPPPTIFEGWTEHLRQDWSEVTHATDLDPGKGTYILVAAQRKDNGAIVVAAMGERASVLQPTASTHKGVPHNGAYWYLVDECGFGFSKVEKILLISADACQDEADYRCCFALEHGGGFRAGALTGVDQPLWKLIYYR